MQFTNDISVTAVHLSYHLEHIEKFAEDLKELYQRDRPPNSDGIPTIHTRNSCYVEPAITNTAAEDSQTKITLKDILKPREDGRPVRCVLIEGAPGVGKSALAWEECHKWAMNQLERKFNLAVLISLGEAQKPMSIEDISPQFKKNLKGILASVGNGKGLLLVLDGFDELSHEQQQAGSIFIDLINGLKLPKATIIVTTRPSVSANLMKQSKHRIDRNIKILGLTRDGVQKFVMIEFSGSERKDEFLHFISNPIIKEMMYFPLNAVIITTLFKEKQVSTITKLFDGLTRALIRRHLIRNKQVSDSFIMPHSLQCQHCLSQLPSEAADKFIKLLQEAYEGLIREEYVLTNLGNDFDHLGLMEKTQGLSVSVGPTYAFSYLHQTLQEYLAALHIYYFPNLEVPTSFGKTDFLRFLAGLCSTAENNADLLCLKVGNLLRNITDDGVRNLQLARCVYEYRTILQKIPLTCELDTNF